jgi:hypothetical protein
VRLADGGAVETRAEGDDLVLTFATPLDGGFAPAIAISLSPSRLRRPSSVETGRNLS